MEDCIFCRIIRGEIPCNKVFEDTKVLAFDDIHPMAPVHVVVVPKRHIPTFLDLDDDLTSRALLKAVQDIARIKGVDKSGFRTVANTNKEGGQVIFHLHLHVLGGRQLMDEMG